MRDSASAADLYFYFDPVCPFCWMTSKWVRMVAARRRYRVDWRFISLRLLNAHVDYAAHFPPEYEAGHTAGLRLLRLAARVRAEHGPDVVGRLYEALGAAIFDAEFVPDAADAHGARGTRAFVAPVLAAAGLPAELSDALDDPVWDATVQTETDEALALTGKDVGTPILHFDPPDGAAFFGPVISRLPGEDEAEQLWDHVVALARFPGFAELKRSLRELPQLRALGVAQGDVGVVQEWEAGSRRLTR
jgi:2-hydroxychromene-2-carboxylate isomerase